MSDTPEKTKKATPEKVHTPHQDALDAKAARQKVESEKAANNQALVDDGKVVALTPITSYETAREALGTPIEETPKGA